MIRPRDSLPSFAPAASRDFPALRRVLLFTLPYRMHMVGAMLALLAASATVLGLGQGLRRLVDDGFKSGDAETLDHAVLALIGVVVLLAGSTFCRFYLVSWIGRARCRRHPPRSVRPGHRTEPGLFRGPPHWRYSVAAHHRHDSVADGNRLDGVAGAAQRSASGRGLAMLAVTSIKL